MLLQSKCKVKPLHFLLQSLHFSKMFCNQPTFRNSGMSLQGTIKKSYRALTCCFTSSQTGSIKFTFLEGHKADKKDLTAISGCQRLLSVPIPVWTKTTFSIIPKFPRIVTQLHDSLAFSDDLQKPLLERRVRVPALTLDSGRKL